MEPSLKQSDFGQLQSGFLSHLFGQGGVDKTLQVNNPSDDINNTNALSLHAIEHAEWNLGHLLDKPKDIEAAHIAKVFHIDEYRNKTIKNYSVDDVISEQSGGPSDANLVTAGGYMKQGTTDPDAHITNEREKQRKSYQFLNSVINEQQRIDRYLAALEEKMATLSDQIAEHNEHIKDLETVQDILNDGDINDDSASGKARRSKVETILKSRGLTLDDFKKPDGSIDQEALERSLDEKRTAIEIERDQKQEQLQKYEEERKALSNPTTEKEHAFKAAIASGNPQEIAAAKDDLVQTSGLNGQEIVITEDTTEELTQKIETLAQTDRAEAEPEAKSQATDIENTIALVKEDDGWSLDFLDAPVARLKSIFTSKAEEGQAPQQASNVVDINTPQGNTYGSAFAEERNVISAAFASASDGTTTVAPTPIEEPIYTVQPRTIALG